MTNYLHSDVQATTSFGITQIPGGAATVSEALSLAKADWAVTKTPIFDGVTMDPIEGFSRIGRDDDSSITLNVCKSTYEPIDNADAFGIIDDVLGKSHAQVERVGQIKDGKICYIQAKMPESIEVLKGDGMDMYITGITSHDGSYLTQVFFTSIRQVCHNQTTAMRKDGKKGRRIGIRHTKNAPARIEQAASILMEGVQEWDTIRENAEIMARKSVNRAQTKAFIDSLFPAPEDSSKQDRNAKKREIVAELVESGMGTEIAGVRGSAWGLFNAATEYLDHHANTRSDTVRFNRSLLEGDTFRRQAFEAAMAV